MAVFSGYNQSLDARSDASEELCCARRAHESVLIGSKLYVFGGYCLRDYPEHEFEFRRQQIFSYDIVTKKWIQHTTKAENDSKMPRPCTGAKCAALGHTIYSFGGLQVNITDQMRLFSNKTYALDTTTMTWRCCKVDGTAVPSGRDKYALCVDDTRLLIFGGWSLRIDKNRLQDGAVWVPEEDKIVGWNNELYAFETETEKWVSIHTSGTRPSPRAAHTMNKVGDDRVILFGGRQPDRRMNDIHVLNLRTMTWSGVILPSGGVNELWPSPRSLHSMCLVAKSLVLIGGMNRDGDCCKDFAWVLDVDQMKWEKLFSKDKSLCRTWHTTSAASFVGGYTELYTFGGTPDNIWKPGSRDLRGPAVITMGVKSLYRLCLEAVELHRGMVHLSIHTLPLSIQEEFWARYGRSGV